jgi:hypothetical protein
MSIAAIFGLITAVLPVVLEVIKLFSSTPEQDREKVKGALLERIARVRAALKKAEDTEGDTQDIEDLINGKK